jgi:23S rRNA pseudouridine1911/1915/1917 synthase
MEPEIILETPEVVAVNKPAGLQVHPARHADEKKNIVEEQTLTDWFVARYPESRMVGDGEAAALERPGVVHRLDKSTSGVIILARTQEAFNFLKTEFMSREVKKTYAAIIRGIPSRERGVIDSPIGIVNGTLKRSVRSTRIKMKKEAITEYFVREKFKEYSLVEAYPKTGRTHQIRVHLASIRHPIAGDTLYGGKKHPLWASRVMLHSWRLEIQLPKKTGRVLLEAPYPHDFDVALQMLRAV